MPTVNGTNTGVIKSYLINNGLIRFDDADTFAAALGISSGNLANVFSYLQTNITMAGNTVAFNADGDAYLFQDGGANDTLVELTGINVGSVNTTSLAVDALWIA
ncbi:MAG: hypothetical protein ACXW09_15255 [Methylococcaceae bacterium]